MLGFNADNGFLENLEFHVVNAQTASDIPEVRGFFTNFNDFENEAERREVTLFFAPVDGVTSYKVEATTDLDAEEWTEFPEEFDVTNGWLAKVFLSVALFPEVPEKLFFRVKTNE